jgi:hypothetical protein
MDTSKPYFPLCNIMYKKIDGYHHHENPTKAMRALGNGYHVHAAADGRRHLRLRWPRRSLVMLVIQRIRLGGTRWQFLLRNTWHPKKPQGSNRGFVAAKWIKHAWNTVVLMLFRSNKLTRDEVGNHNLLDVGESVRCTATLT